MANEFKVKNGLIVDAGTGLIGATVTGSMNISGNIAIKEGSGKLQGTASWADNAISASHALIADTVLGTIASASQAVSASYATSASQAVSASYALSSSYSFNANVLSGSVYVLSGSVSATLNDIISHSSSFATTGSNIFIGNEGITGSLQINNTVINASSSLITTTGSSNLITVTTSSYSSVFVKYLAVSQSNIRAGQIISAWGNNTVQYNEVSTNDIGVTTDVTFSVVLSGANAILQTSLLTPNWTIKLGWDLL